MVLNGLALCAGVGALEIAVGSILPLRTVCYVERDPRKVRILRARFRDGCLHDGPVWDDLSTFDAGPWEGVDVVTGGWPCQGFSTASRGRPTHPDLWPDVLRIIETARPSLVFLENVDRAPWEAVSSDLRRAGFRSAYRRVRAADVGAPHKRSRTFLAAYADRDRERRCSLNVKVASAQAVAAASYPDGALTLGVDDGSPGRMDRLRACGDALVPLAAAYAYRSLLPDVVVNGNS